MSLSSKLNAWIKSCLLYTSSTATADDFGGVTYFPTAGAYDEEELLDLIAHVEAAANGKPATIIGTKKAVRNLAPSIQGTDCLLYTSRCV